MVADRVEVSDDSDSDSDCCFHDRPPAQHTRPIRPIRRNMRAFEQSVKREISDEPLTINELILSESSRTTKYELKEPKNSHFHSSQIGADEKARLNGRKPSSTSLPDLQVALLESQKTMLEDAIQCLTSSLPVPRESDAGTLTSRLLLIIEQQQSEIINLQWRYSSVVDRLHHETALNRQITRELIKIESSVQRFSKLASQPMRLQNIPMTSVDEKQYSDHVSGLHGLKHLCRMSSAAPVKLISRGFGSDIEDSASPAVSESRPHRLDLVPTNRPPCHKNLRDAIMPVFMSMDNAFLNTLMSTLKAQLCVQTVDNEHNMAPIPNRDLMIDRNFMLLGETPTVATASINASEETTDGVDVVNGRFGYFNINLDSFPHVMKVRE